MRLIRLKSVTDGMTLARDVRTGRPNETPLLRAGVELSASYAARLSKMGILAVWIDDALSHGIEPQPPLDPDERLAAESSVSESFESTSRALAKGQNAMPPAELELLTTTVAQIASSLADVPEATLALNDLATADAYTHRHSLQVAVIGMLIARRFWNREGWRDWQNRERRDGIDGRLTKLGVGLVLHDLGKLTTPPEILQKPGRLTDEEMAIMQRHPQAGVELLAATRPSPLVIATVRDHHERLDGSGYPAGRTADKIHEFARICAIADVYDAVTSERPYKSAAPAYVGVNIIGEGELAGQYDDAITWAFRRVCFPFPLGSEVGVTEGVTGVVSEVDPLEPWMPLVRYAEADAFVERVIDLRHMDALRRSEFSAQSAA
jgi:HD-GYP domain-containing protein (c-di-GMP phosphodiesterase class II)